MSKTSDEIYSPRVLEYLRTVRKHLITMEEICTSRILSGKWMGHPLLELQVALNELFDNGEGVTCKDIEKNALIQSIRELGGNGYNLD
jgi:hypothetical protein